MWPNVNNFSARLTLLERAIAKDSSVNMSSCPSVTLVSYAYAVQGMGIYSQHKIMQRLRF